MIQKIEIVRGTSNRFQITIVDADGNPFTLPSGGQVKFGIGIPEKPGVPGECFCTKQAPTCTDGVCAFDIAPEDTADLEPGRYWYDVGVQVGDDYYNVIEPSPVDIIANVTAKG